MCAKFFKQIYSQLTLMRTMNLNLGKSKNKKMKSILQSNAMESIIRMFFSIQEILKDSLITSNYLVRQNRRPAVPPTKAIKPSMNNNQIDMQI